MADETRDGWAKAAEESRHAAGIRHEVAAHTALGELQKMGEHDARRLEQAMVFSGLASLANRDATLELAALVRMSRDERAQRIVDGRGA